MSDPLHMWFQSVDIDNSGSINAAELKRALEAGNLHFPPTVISQMIKMYDKNLDGTMNFEEFVSLHKFLSVVQDTFSRNSRNRGILTLNEIHPALQQAGYSLDRPSFYTVCQSFDNEKSGNFRLDDFMSICIFLQSAQNLFTAFDTERTGHVTLDFNQFVYCSANLRI
jgi:Ca2+-binding EF-hand superfamily protein